MPEAPCQSRVSGEVGSGVREGDAAPHRGGAVHVSDRPATDFFIAGSYRPGQREAIERAEDAFKRGYKLVIIEAPTGIGKSQIAQALASWSSYAHILTPQKILQSQYQRDFPEMFVMKGRNAYPCHEGKTCAEGSCRVKHKTLHDDCPYAQALMNARMAATGVHNFDSFHYQTMLGRGFGHRELLIVDECHAIEPKFLGFMEITLTNYKKPRLIIPKYKTLKEYDKFLEMQYEEIVREIAEAEQAANDRYSSKPLDVIMKDMEELQKLELRLSRYFEKRETVEYVCEFDGGEARYNSEGKCIREARGYQSVTIKPVFVGAFVRDSLLSQAERVLMMSATILSKKLFCENVGINPEECVFIQVPGYFPAENRPVYRRYVGNMNKDTIHKTLPEMVKEIKVILAEYPNDRGIIQTHTNFIAEYIKAHINDPRLTFNKDYDRVDDTLEAHASKPGSFIVAAGLKEGVDLKDELSVVQIICKVSYPDMGDVRVARRMKLTPQYYPHQTATMLVQMFGRSVRSETDHAVTFILDSGFDHFYARNNRLIPKYIQEAIQDWYEEDF